MNPFWGGDSIGRMASFPPNIPIPISLSLSFPLEFRQKPVLRSFRGLLGLVGIKPRCDTCIRRREKEDEIERVMQIYQETAKSRNQRSSRGRGKVIQEDYRLRLAGKSREELRGS